jgi:hypothetical protein
MRKEIINKDKNGKIITDLSKVVIPEEMNKRLFSILNPQLTISK